MRRMYTDLIELGQYPERQQVVALGAQARLLALQVRLMEEGLERCRK